MPSEHKNNLNTGGSAGLLIGAVLVFGALGSPQPAAAQTVAKGPSPALCGRGDVREPGIQGEVPAGVTDWKYNCGVRLIGQLPLRGNVQGVGKCAYVRVSAPRTRPTIPGPGVEITPGRGGTFDRDAVTATIHVIDVSNPARPREVRTVPVKYASETFRVVANRERAVMVSGSSVYDIRDCLNPVLKGEIQWPAIHIGRNPPPGGGGGTGMLPHDLRINHAGTKVYGSFGLWEVDITNLNDPTSWKITDHRCEIASQIAGPWQEIHRAALSANRSICADAANPNGANWMNAASSVQTTLLWPTLSHGITTSGDDKRVYIADQAPGAGWVPGPTLHVVDLSQGRAKVLGKITGAGHSTDWFSTAGREYVLHANEGGTSGIGPARGGDPCAPYPRSQALGWAFEAYVTDVTDPARPANASMLGLAINHPDNCQVRKASGRDPWVAYHMIDNPMNARFAAVNFNSSGLRIFDIRNPAQPTEVAYFNHGALAHAGVGYYDAARGLIYAAGTNGLWVLALEPQVKARLGL